jgi:hypothetical protein
VAQRTDGAESGTVEPKITAFQDRSCDGLIGRYGALLPLFRLVGVPCIAAFSESEKPTVSPQLSPETGEQVGRLFRRCDIFDWRSFGFGLFARFIGVVQEPIDQPGAALLHHLRVLGLLPILEDFIISLVAHGILHLRAHQQ